MANTLETEHVLDVYKKLVDVEEEISNELLDYVRIFLEEKGELKGIDIGCGSGHHLIHKNIVGVDACKSYYKKIKNNQFVVANCIELPFEDESFDYAICLCVFQHLSTEERRLQAISEMIRVIKKGSEGLISIPSSESDVGDTYISIDNTSLYSHIYNENMFVELLNTVVQKHNIEINKVCNRNNMWVIQFLKKT